MAKVMYLPLAAKSFRQICQREQDECSYRTPSFDHGEMVDKPQTVLRVLEGPLIRYVHPICMYVCVHVCNYKLYLIRRLAASFLFLN